MSTDTNAPRIIVVQPGETLSGEVLGAFRDPEKLISGRHARRDASGRMIARRQFQVAVPR